MLRLKNFRKEKGKTQESMARSLGITLSMYEKVENGKTGASAAFMKRLKKSYPDADINYIFFETDSNNFA